MNTKAEIGATREQILERRKGYAEALVRHGVCQHTEEERADRLAKAALPIPPRKQARIVRVRHHEYRVVGGGLETRAVGAKLWCRLLKLELSGFETAQSDGPALLRTLADLYEDPTEWVEERE